MTFPFSSRRTLQKTPLPPQLSAPPPANVESAGLQLATTYRVQRPSIERIGAFKHQVGWSKLDDEGRFRVQQLLFALVARAGNAPVKFPYREAIVADFAVSIDTSSRFQQQERVLAGAPALERELEAAKNRSHVAEERARALRSQYEDVVGERDTLADTCASLLERSEELQQRLETHRHYTLQLYADLPPARGGVRFGSQRGEGRQRYSLIAVPPVPEEVTESGHRAEDASTVASA